MKNEHRHRLSFIITDYITTSVAWLLFNIVRYYTLEQVNYANSLPGFLSYSIVLWGQFFIPLFMLGLYWLSGFYNHTFSKSRLEVFSATAGSVGIGVIGIYFIAIIDDPIPDRYSNYELLIILTALLTGLVLTGRLIITSLIRHRIASGALSDRVLVIGNRDDVVKCVSRLSAYRTSMGMEVAAVAITDNRPAPAHLKAVSMDQLQEKCPELNINKLILAVKPGDSTGVLSMVRRLYCLNLPVMIPAWSAGSILARVKVRNITGEPLTDLASVSISESQRNIKRLIDVSVSALSLLLLSPLMATLAVMVKRDSKGPVFYSQERVGMHRRKFRIYKFRTMRTDAELDGPALSTDNDSRITRLGHTLRKYRLDELPQFWNVLKGDMSLVGPRPEREFYEEQIIKRAPHYTLVHQMRPGITSWGMVKYGYASTVDQMIERLAYDMIYLENVSLLVDVKIMFHTVRTVLTGKGI